MSSSSIFNQVAQASLQNITLRFSLSAYIGPLDWFRSLTRFDVLDRGRGIDKSGLTRVSKN